MKGRNRPGVRPTHPNSQTGIPSQRGKPSQRALTLWLSWLSRPELTPSWVAELRAGALEEGQGPDQWSKLLGQTGCGWIPALPLTAVHPEQLNQLL